MSRLGEFHLQESILEVLYKAKLANPENEHGIGAADISRRSGIYRGPKKKKMNDSIVTGLLYQLHEMGKVKRANQVNNRPGWRINDNEYKRRQDDIDD